ncbi:hypothetical protein AQUSIP_22630 [Aquicella siphonis]|uniref:Uncharacterized protein n=1 Tax=Aquicella siphonis TaxID=254247 RepID=A0A5E4PL36_9COXI|nr:hypothetical protein [Aquicella siphonis]VVC76936.1 hypothetical protein AQUSIP_22630 [Aquicella siphonis]
MSTARIVVKLKKDASHDKKKPHAFLPDDKDLLTIHKSDHQEQDLIAQGYYHPNAYQPSLQTSLDDLNQRLSSSLPVRAASLPDASQPEQSEKASIRMSK